MATTERQKGMRGFATIRAAIAGVPMLIALAGCGKSDNLVSDDAGWVDFADADPFAPDAGPHEGCDPGSPQCNNCVDDDDDGLVDGFDPECVGPLDDREDSFSTGIAGDNIDAIKQDCFFDGNSGAGDDRCDMHVCCLLDLGDEGCPPEYKPSQFDPEDCEPSADCIANCLPLTPPGCDCFGCCTICNDAGDCYDILTNEAVAPDCDQSVIADPALCPRCVKTEDCNPGDCVPLECNLCPGMTPDDLPPECDSPTCPGDLTPCVDNTDCLEDQFCSVGCCIHAIG